MGADFIFAALTWPSDDEGKALPAGPGVVSETLRRLMIALSDETIDFENFGYDVEGETDEEIAEERSGVVEECADFIRTTFSTYNWPRDIGYMEHGPFCNLMLTGGTSWGDDPSDSYKVMQFLDYLGVSKDPYDRAAIEAFDAKVAADNPTVDNTTAAPETTPKD
jgi:hypothetical protein